jgi:hypothetical protein
MKITFTVINGSNPVKCCETLKNEISIWCARQEANVHNQEEAAQSQREKNRYKGEKIGYQNVIRLLKDLEIIEE